MSLAKFSLTKYREELLKSDNILDKLIQTKPNNEVLFQLLTISTRKFDVYYGIMEKSTGIVIVDIVIDCPWSRQCIKSTPKKFLINAYKTWPKISVEIDFFSTSKYANDDLLLFNIRLDEKGKLRMQQIFDYVGQTLHKGMFLQNEQNLCFVKTPWCTTQISNTTSN